MKKLYFLASLAVAAFAFTSCEADKEPVYHDPNPATFVLNTPPMANQLYLLENSATVELTTSQPDYGVATTTNYSVDVTLADKFVEAGEGTEANYKTITPKSPTQARIELDAKALDEALCQLKGIGSFQEYPEEGIAPVKVTMRAHAWINGFPSSECVSNDIVLKAVQLYNPYPEGGRVIYWIGDVSGWNVDKSDAASLYADWVLTETGKGTNIYVGSFDIPKGSKNFRFYTQLGNWDKGSLGSSTDGSVNKPVDFTRDGVNLEVVAGGTGNWCTEATWEGGFVTFTVNLSEYDVNDPANSKVTVLAQKGNFDFSKMKAIYLVGDCSAWSVSEANAEEIYANYKLYDYDDNGIYSGTFEIAAGKATFRFYTALGNWDAGSLGAQVEDNPVEKTMTDGAYSGPYVEGKGSWKFADWAGGKMKMTVNTNDMTVNFETVAAE